MNKSKKNALLTAVGCALIMFAHGGMTNTFALSLPEFVTAFGETSAKIAVAVTVGTIFSFILSLVGGKIISKLTPRVTLFISSVCAFGYGLMHYLAPNVIWLYVAGCLSGFILALGMHACVAGLLVAHTGYFGKKISSTLALVFAIMTLGSAVYQFVMGQVNAIVGWRVSFLIFGIVSAVIGIVANLFFLKPPVQEETHNTASEASAAPEVGGLSVSEALKTPSFYLLFIGIAMAAMMMAGMSTYATSFWQTYGLEATTSATILSLLSIACMLGSYLTGLVMQKWGGKAFLIFVFLGFAIGIILECIWSGSQVSALLYIALLFLMWGIAGNAISSQLVPSIFGRKSYNEINPIFMGAYYLGCALVSVLVGAIAEATSYVIAFYVLAGFAVFGLICCLLALTMAPYKKIKQ